MTGAVGNYGASGAVTYTGDAGVVATAQTKTDVQHTEVDASAYVAGKDGDTETNGGLKTPEAAANSRSSKALAAMVNNLSPQQVRVDIYAVMGLMQKVAQEQRTAARETRMAEADAQTSALMAAAGEIRSAAKDRLIGGLISGGMAIGGGVVSMIGAAKEAKALSKTAGPEIPQAGALTKEQAMEINPDQVAKKAALNEQLQKDFGSIQLKKTGASAAIEPQGLGALNQQQAMDLNPSQVARKAELNAQFTQEFDHVKFAPTASGTSPGAPVSHFPAGAKGASTAGALTPQQALVANSSQVANKANLNAQFSQEFDHVKFTPTASGVAPGSPGVLKTHFPAEAAQPAAPTAGTFTKQQAMELNPSQVARKADLNAQFTQNPDRVKIAPTASGVAPLPASTTHSTHFPAEAGKTTTPELTGSALEASIAAKGRVWQSAAQTITATGGLASEMANFTASLHDARKAELEASASAHDAAANQANDEMQQMQDMLRDIRDKLSAMEQSNIETNRGMARNI